MDERAGRADPGPSGETVVVVAGGDPVGDGALVGIPSGVFVVAADAGIERALAVGLRVDLAVGDFDSVSPVVLDAVVREGTQVEEHPEAKDHTDLELALDAALRRRPARIVVLGGHGGRLDHFLANALLLASPRWRGVEIVARMGGATVTVARHHAEIRGVPGDLVTLVPAHGPALGVTTTGLLYPLAGEDLVPGSTRGVSNELTLAHASVHVRDGAVLVIQPGHRGTHHRRSPP